MNIHDRNLRAGREPDDGNIWRAIAAGLILMSMLAGLIIALVMVWRVVGG